MKHKIKYPAFLAFTAVSLLLMSNGLEAQPVYRPVKRPAYRYSGIFDNTPANQSRQTYGPYVRGEAYRPYLKLGIHFDPLISWFTTQSYDVRNDGPVPGFSFGLTYNSYFGRNYSFSSGIRIINAGGRLICNEATTFEIRNFDREIVNVDPYEPIIYRVNYISVPLGVKLETDQLGYGKVFADLGFDPKIMVLGTAAIPSINVRSDNAMAELRKINLGWHIMAGFEYPLGTSNDLTMGIGFENNFLDATRDIGNQPWDIVSNKILSFRIGVAF